MTQCLANRLVIKSPKVLILTFELLEYLSFACDLPLLQQISSKDFLMRVGAIIRAKISEQVLARLAALIRVWQVLMEEQRDLLDMFWKFNGSLQQRSELSIPSTYTSRYAAVATKAKSKHVTRADRELQERQRREEPELTAPVSRGRPAPSKGKGADLSLMSECIIVINEIIDSCDHKDRIGENEMLN